MPQRSGSNREIQRQAHRIFAPAIFGVFAFVAFQALKLLAVAVAWGFVVVLVSIGLYLVPQAIRTFREML